MKTHLWTQIGLKNVKKKKKHKKQTKKTTKVVNTGSTKDFFVWISGKTTWKMTYSPCLFHILRPINPSLSGL